MSTYKSNALHPLSGVETQTRSRVFCQMQHSDQDMASIILENPNIVGDRTGSDLAVGLRVETTDTFAAHIHHCPSETCARLYPSRYIFLAGPVDP
jgi:hypothetical protein